MSFAINYICRPFHFHILGKNCPWRICLPVYIQIMTLVTKYAIFNKPTTKMLVWLHLAELIIEKKHNQIPWGAFNQYMRLRTSWNSSNFHWKSWDQIQFSPEKCSVRTPSCFCWTYLWIWIVLHVAIGSTCTNTHATYQNLAPNVWLKMTITDAQCGARTPCSVRTPIWKPPVF